MIVAAYQGPSCEGDVDRGLAKVDEVLRDAAAKSAQMVVFPELYLPGYNQMSSLARVAQGQGGAWEVEFARLAALHQCGLCIGWAENDGGVIYNSASAYDAAGVKLGHYRKIQLWGPTEQSVFAFGEDYCTFELGGVKSALLICYDIEFPQHVRALADRGVERILVPTANPADFSLVCNTLVPARAAEANVTIIYANYSGSDDGLAFCGQSTIVGPYAMTLAQATRDEEALLIADLQDIETLDPSLLSTQDADFRKVSL